MRGSTAGSPERRQLDYSLESRVARKRRKVGGDGLSDDVASGDWFDFPFEFLTPSGDDTAPCRSREGEHRLHCNDARGPDDRLGAVGVGPWYVFFVDDGGRLSYLTPAQRGCDADSRSALARTRLVWRKTHETATSRRRRGAGAVRVLARDWPRRWHWRQLAWSHPSAQFHSRT